MAHDANDSFDSFLVAYSNPDLEVLLSRSAPPARGSRRPVSPQAGPSSTRPRFEVQAADVVPDDQTEPPSPEYDLLEEPRRDQTSSAAVEEADGLAKRVAEVERKMHNALRGGRNRMYYEILHKYGPEKAKAFYVAPEIRPSDVNPPPAPKVRPVGSAGVGVCPPPPPPPVRSAASTSAGASCSSAPWRTRSMAPPPAPKQPQYLSQ